MLRFVLSEYEVCKASQMSESESRFNQIYRWLTTLSYLGLIFALAFIVVAILKIVGHLEELAPAELRLLLQVLKNRFFQ